MLYDTFLDRARNLGVGPERIYHIAGAEEACRLVIQIGGAASRQHAALRARRRNGVAICTLREEGLSLNTHLVARAENRSKS